MNENIKASLNTLSDKEKKQAHLTPIFNPLFSQP